MIKAPVLKPFTTRASRYKPGDFVTQADFSGHGFDLAHAQERGFVGELVDNETAQEPAAPAEAARKTGKK